MAWLAIAISFFLPIADGKRMFALLGILFKFFARQKKYSKHPARGSKHIKDIVPYDRIRNDMIDFKEYYAAVLEISPIQFWLLNPEKQEMVINCLANALRMISVGQSASFVKIAKPMVMDNFIYNED